ncbi:MAG: diacylglycerol kinase [Gammaproteobacteria bacterium]|nr:diacylglycerol kinase [Gammaproteobacteria bacterium]
MKPGKTGIARIIAAGGYSWQGLIAAFKHEAAFRQELFLATILVPLAIWLGETGFEIALMIASLFIVLIVEIINSAIEAIVDRLGSEWHELSGRAKDMGSAAVLLALLNVLITWLLILFL